jgi:GNAT superfamily N-acetyltransferase
MVHDMRQMAMLGPMLSLTQRVAPLLTGLVCYEGARLIGNVSLTQDSRAGSYSLSNVAVLPEYRTQGIAGSLVDAAIAKARSSGAKRIVLQVRPDNATAIAIYRHRGFERYATLHEVNLRPGNWPVAIGQRQEGLRRVRASDSRALYELVASSTPRAVLWRHPVSAREYRRGLGWHLRQYMQLIANGQEQTEVVAERAGQLVGYVSAITRMWRGPHEFELYIARDHRGRWEAPLLFEMFRQVSRLSRYSMRGQIQASHPEALAALEDLGFETLRVLDQMSLEL